MFGLKDAKRSVQNAMMDIIWLVKILVLLYLQIVLKSMLREFAPNVLTASYLITKETAAQKTKMMVTLVQVTVITMMMTANPIMDKVIVNHKKMMLKILERNIIMESMIKTPVNYAAMTAKASGAVLIIKLEKDGATKNDTAIKRDIMMMILNAQIARVTTTKDMENTANTVNTVNMANIMEVANTIMNPSQATHTIVTRTHSQD